jgi:hypothetical protein
LCPHYLELGPLYSFTSVQTVLSDMPQMLESSDADADSLSAGASPPPQADRPNPIKTGDAEIDKLVEQMNGRIAAALRTLVPAARMLITIIGEYSKAVEHRQLGMMQSNALKIEQKGKDLAAKLADFERLCRSPISVGGADSQRLRQISAHLAERSDDPDVRLLRSLAQRAATFREDQTAAIVDLDAIIPEAQDAIERMKR